MALNVGEANALHTLLEGLGVLPSTRRAIPLGPEQVAAAAALLARGAYKTLHAGVDESQVREAVMRFFAAKGGEQ